MARKDTAAKTQNLEQWLWAAADILRGPVDKADFKSYIFPLLFLKRLSDVYDEEFEQALLISGNDEEFALLPDQHRFQIPDGAHWRDLRASHNDVGRAIQTAMRAIESSNVINLTQIFGDVNWTNKARLPDSLLRDLVDHFSTKNLATSAVPNDMLGDAYEFLIKKFADKSRKKAGEFFTPRTVVELMVNILDPRPGETIYDPACGSGGMLIETVKHVREEGGDPRLLFGKIFGQEKNVNTSAIAKMNLILHGVEDFNIATGDTLREPAFVHRDALMSFDCVIANPPFSLKEWGDDMWEHDRWRRNIAGTPPTSNGDWAWLQHMISSMTPATGRLAVVLPLGALFRGQKEGKIRSALLATDIFEAVIELGPNLFYGASIPACILVARQHKQPERQGKIVFIDASTMYRTGRNQNTLESNHLDEILQTYRQFTDIPGRSRVVTIADVEAQGGDMSIGKYVTRVNTDVLPSADEALASLRAAIARTAETQAKVMELLKSKDLL